MTRQTFRRVPALTFSAVLLATLVVPADAASSARGGGRECKSTYSLTVKGMTCKRAEKLLPGAFEAAMVADSVDVYKFKYKGFKCRLPRKNIKKIVCNDNEPRKRSFVYVDR